MADRITASVNKSNPELTRLQRARARQLGMGIEPYRVLLCLRSAGRPLTYREIESETGYYFNLARNLRAEINPGSLGARGLVLEGTDGMRKLTFEITSEGEKALRSVDNWHPPEKVKRVKVVPIEDAEPVIAADVDGVEFDI